VNGVVTAAAAAAAAAAVDATRLLCLDEHVTHSLQSESNDLVSVKRQRSINFFTMLNFYSIL